MYPRRHPAGWSVVGGLAQASVDQTPVQITGNDWEESIGTSGCRLSPLCYGDRLNRDGSQFQCRSRQTFPNPVERTTNPVGGHSRTGTHHSERKNKRYVRLCVELSWQTADADQSGESQTATQGRESQSGSENTLHHQTAVWFIRIQAGRGGGNGYGKHQGGNSGGGERESDLPGGSHASDGCFAQDGTTQSLSPDQAQPKNTLSPGEI